MNILEITGPPCSGKSYLSNSLLKNDNIVLFNYEWVAVSLKFGWLPKIVQRICVEFYLTFAGLYCLGIVRNTRLLKSLLHNHWSYPRRLNVWRNVLRKFGTHQLASRQKSSKLLLYDEGISHLPYLFATSNAKCPQTIRTYYPFGHPIIIRMNTEFSEIVIRLKTRGHKMVRRKSEAEIFATKNQKACEYQREDLELFPQNRILQSNGAIEDIFSDLKKLNLL